MSEISIKHIALDSIDSTNNYSKELDGGLYISDDGRHQAVLVTAEEQTAGRGRYGRSFHSPAGSGIYMSFSFRPIFSQTDSLGNTLVTAAVVHRVLSQYTDDRLDIKWVNDIYRDGRKIVGILTEGVQAVNVAGSAFDRIIIGIGINIYPMDVPDELSGIIGSLVDAKHAADIRPAIITEIADGLAEAFVRMPYEPSEYVEYYKSFCFNYPAENDLI